MSSNKRSMAIVRGRSPNLAEISIYRSFLEHFDLTFFFCGPDSGKCRAQLDAFGMNSVKAVRFTSISDLMPSEFVRRALDYKVGLGSYMLSHLKEVLSHDYINVIDPAFGFTRQIVRALRPSQKLIVVCWENIHGRYDRIWLAAGRTSRVFERANTIVCVSQAAVSTLCVAGRFSGKIVQIYPGIDLQALPSNGSKTAARERPVRDGQRQVILFVGRLQWTKGLQVLLVALRILRERIGFDVDLWVIGGGDDTLFKALAERLSIERQVRFLGVLSNSDVRQKMAEVDLFCFPSLLSRNWMEQYGFAVVEAMAHGLPIVTFDSGSIREICGDAAIYASAGNAHSLAEAIARTLENMSEALDRGERLRQRAFREFDADLQGKKMLEAIP